MRLTLLVMFIAMAFASTNAFAHGKSDARTTPRTSADPVDRTPFGYAGDPARVTRTVSIAMDDKMRFYPSSISVRTGETIRFVVMNRGELMHEMVLGTDDELRRHAELMRKFPEMEHEEAHMVHVKAGAKGDMVWTFDKAGQFAFACLIPGHFEAGMLGTVVVR